MAKAVGTLGLQLRPQHQFQLQLQLVMLGEKAVGQMLGKAAGQVQILGVAKANLGKVLAKLGTAAKDMLGIVVKEMLGIVAVAGKEMLGAMAGLMVALGTVGRVEKVALEKMIGKEEEKILVKIRAKAFYRKCQGTTREDYLLATCQQTLMNSRYGMCSAHMAVWTV